ncbi:hypothetical protein AAB992_07170 [Burkholderia contaminans]|uniref:hypothetical protein n=2 Tax=Burkholderia contaminans TaxID=488447 RepID=UPI002417F361|nr:hypothetical protein [Burkholderia contaminans]WFN13185.1 hypothetical protein LXE92_19665 [Burkholderia contaminans]
MRKWMRIALFLLFSTVTGAAVADSYHLAPVVDRYGACTWREDEDNVYITMEIDFKGAYSDLGGGQFYSRALTVYTYDDKGTLTVAPYGSAFVRLDGNIQAVIAAVGTTSWTYTGWFPTGWANGSWGEIRRFTAKMEIQIMKYIVRSEWPGYAFRAANHASTGIYGESSGVAYVSRYGTNGQCTTIVDPTVPPPPQLSIMVSAPDWNLGELSEGDSQKVFQNITDQLCFSYSGPAVNGKKFVINASNANGMVGNRYQLKNVADASQLVPYSVTLDSGSSTISLPNSTSAALSFGSSGRTCFIPTFKTTVDSALKEGDYSDALIFTVVTKS